MRRTLCWVLALGGCSFDVPGLDPLELLDAAKGGDAGMPDDASTGGPDLAPPPDSAQPSPVLFVLDARSPAYFANAAQPYLSEFPATVAHYRFDEAADPIKDSVGGHALTALANSGVARQRFTWLPAANGGGFTRVGAELRGPGLAAADATVLDFGAEDFTVEAWFRLPPGYSPACDAFFTKGAPSQRGYGACAGPNGVLRMFVNDGTTLRFVDSGAGFADGAWHLAAFVFRTTQANSAALYVDGQDLQPLSPDLSASKGVSNGAVFTVGGAGAGDFRGSLAELIVHRGVLSLAAHRNDYHAFAPPVTTGDPAGVSYKLSGPACPVIVSDGGGDKVACYASAQFAVATNAAASATGNGARLGMLTGPGATNYAFNTEAFDQWGRVSTTVVADAAPSPRADRTADTITLPASSDPYPFIYEDTGLVPPAPPFTATFSVWLRAESGGSAINLHVNDGYDVQFRHCRVNLTQAWTRYSCSCTFNKKPALVEIMLDTHVNLPGDDGKPLAAATFDAWGAQLELTATPSVYAPNASSIKNSSSQWGPVDLRLDDGAGKYLSGAAGRASVQFTALPGLVDGGRLFEAKGNDGGDLYLRRGLGGILEGAVYDQAGRSDPGGIVATAPLDWTMTHTVELAWSAVAPSTAGWCSAVAVDGTVTPGRAVPYTAGIPTTVQVGGAAPNASGTLHVLTLFNTATP